MKNMLHAGPTQWGQKFYEIKWTIHRIFEQIREELAKLKAQKYMANCCQNDYVFKINKKDNPKWSNY